MNVRLRRLRAALGCAVLLALVLATLAPAAQAQTSPRYFGETGHYLRGAFRSYWEANGGVSLFGFPITEEYRRSADGRVVQYFERARFELAGGGSRPVIELGRVGAEATGGRIFPEIPPFAVPPGRRYFPETLHTLMGLFRTTWESRGGVPIFGLPISEEIYERLDGQFRLVQYFERARFELWPEGVRFGRLGAALAPLQLLAPWPASVAPPGPLNEDGTPRPPAAPVRSGGVALVRVSPAAGRPGQKDFKISAAGFQPGEQLLFWLTAPDGTVYPINQVPSADANGVVPEQANVGFDTSRRDLEGIWYVTGQGLVSGKIGVAAFQIGGDIRAAPENPTGAANVRISPEAGGVGQVFTLLGDGFQGGEKVSVWLTAPDGAVRSLSTSVSADRNGSISSADVRFSFGPGILSGRWAATAQGQSSGLQGIAAFTITGGSAPAPGGPSGPSGSYPPNLRNVIHQALGIRDGRSAVTPLAAAPGATFRVSLAGFSAGEKVSMWLTAPDAQVEGVDAGSIQTNGSGGVTATFTPRSKTEGDWKLTAQGISSGRTTIVPFKLTRDYIAPLGTGRPPSRNGVVSPAQGGRGTVFQLSGTGLRPNEPVDYWITSPDGVYYLVGRVTADSRGRIGYGQTLGVQFGERNPTGVYGYNYQGAISGVRIELYLTYTGQ